MSAQMGKRTIAQDQAASQFIPGRNDDRLGEFIDAVSSPAGGRSRCPGNKRGTRDNVAENLRGACAPFAGNVDDAARRSPRGAYSCPDRPAAYGDARARQRYADILHALARCVAAAFDDDPCCLAQGRFAVSGQISRCGCCACRKIRTRKIEKTVDTGNRGHSRRRYQVIPHFGRIPRYLHSNLGRGNAFPHDDQGGEGHKIHAYITDRRHGHLGDRF